VPHQGEVML